MVLSDVRRRRDERPLPDVNEGRMTAFKLILFAILLALATATTAAPAQGLPTQETVLFITADRTIECVMRDAHSAAGYVDCAYAKALAGKMTPITHDLFLHAHRHWLVQFSGPALKGSSRRELGSEQTRVLRSGETLSVGFFRCSSRVAGLTCVSRHSGHGFFLSGTTQRTF
jgi:hypothetical protein